MAGCGLASLTGFWEVNSPSALLELLVCTTLAPVAGEFGIIAGVIAGFLHAAVAMQIGVLYAGMNLYNNGFAGGVIAIFMVPVMQAVRDRRAEEAGLAVAALCWFLLPVPAVYRQTLVIPLLGPVSSAVPAFTAQLKGDYELSSAINSFSILIRIVMIIAALLIIL